MIDRLLHFYTLGVDWLFERAVEPLLWRVGLMAYVEDAFGWTEFFALGLLTVAVAWLICRPLEAWRPVEVWEERRGVRTDIVYTLLSRLGVIPLVVFVALQPLGLAIDGFLRFRGFVPPSLEQLLPFLEGRPVLTSAAYVLVLDLADYWRHRLQHSLPWWWALHSVHHSQRQMTFWTDDRNHVLDDVLAAAWFGAVAMLIGVEPAQFPLIVLALRVLESFSHLNARVHFGRIGNRLLVSPLYHRLHHSLAHAEGRHARAYGCNFAALFPLWDIVFGTARLGGEWARTGDLSGGEAEATGGWARTQIGGAKRLGRAVAATFRRKERVPA
jgi:sterol desaturase/sphingolipid hydroxylase (fatty acid hydroxylase superfamily)